MFRSRLLKAVCASALIASMAAPTTARPVNTARGDGEPTAAACAELGFNVSGNDRDERGRNRPQPRTFGYAPPAPPPPPPPPPPPMAMEDRSADVTVSGS